jgi:hypothetical protein
MFLFNLQAVLVGVAVFSLPSALLALQLAYILGTSLMAIPVLLGIGLVALVTSALIENYN